MPVSESYRQFITEQLGSVLTIATRRMFGGVGIYTNELFFALMDNDVLYFKVDDVNRPDYEGVGSTPFTPEGMGAMSYYEVPIDVIEDRARLYEWAQAAVEVARRARERKPRKR